MKKSNKRIYWALTGFLAFGMLAQAVTQISHAKGYADMLDQLGYPLYFLTIIGAWKILGVTAVLLPKFPLLKEWAYAGFFFVMSGAVVSHIALGDSFKETAPSLFLLLLTIASWHFRPADRKTISTN